MKVYILTDGQYESNIILGVYSTEEKAEEARNKFPKEKLTDRHKPIYKAYFYGKDRGTYESRIDADDFGIDFGEWELDAEPEK